MRSGSGANFYRRISFPRKAPPPILPMVDSCAAREISPFDSMSSLVRSLVLPCGIAIFPRGASRRSATQRCSLPLQSEHIENDCGERWPAAVWVARRWSGAKTRGFYRGNHRPRIFAALQWRATIEFLSPPANARNGHFACGASDRLSFRASCIRTVTEPCPNTNSTASPSPATATASP
jgi:hypothetical protein